ncbi:MAG: DUF378 domain-containing protein [Desulfobacterales bacterium]
MYALNWITLVLIIVGGINWGLVGLFNFNLVAAIFGEISWFTRLIYILVGISAIYVAVVSPRLAKPASTVRA